VNHAQDARATFKFGHTAETPARLVTGSGVPYLIDDSVCLIQSRATKQDCSGAAKWQVLDLIGLSIDSPSHLDVTSKDSHQLIAANARLQKL